MPKYAAAVLTLTRSKQAMKYIAQGSNKPGLIARRNVRVSFAESIVFQSAINSTNPLISDAFKYNRRTPTDPVIQDNYIWNFAFKIL